MATAMLDGGTLCGVLFEDTVAPYSKGASTDYGCAHVTNIR